MKFLHLPLRPICQSTSNPSKSQYFQTFSLCSTREIAVSNEVLNIINFVNPMEAALENFARFLSPEIVTSVLQEQRKMELGFRFFVWTVKRKQFRSCHSRSFIVDMLIKDNRFDLFWKTLEEIKSSGISIDSGAFVVLIEGYWKLKMAEKAVEAFGRMKDFDCRPDLFTYNMILHVLVQKNVMLLALAVYSMMLKLNCRPNCSTFNILIDGLCKSGKTRDALKLFDEMNQRGVLPTKITFTVILSGLCRAKKTDDAFRLFNLMKSRGCSPDVITYNALLNGFCKLGKVDEAFMLSRSFKKDGYVLGIHGYSCLIDALCKAKRIDEAHDMFDKLSEVNIIPDLVLYTIMIHGLSKSGRVNDALKLLTDMTVRGVIPDTQCYNTLIKGLCDVGLLDQAQSLQLEISMNDCFSDSYTYTILICGMCRKGLVGNAQQIFNEMEELGCSPSVVTFNALIDGLCKAGKLEEAHLMFYKMEIGKNPSLFLRLSQGSDRVLDSAGLQTLVERLCDSGLILKAYKLLMQLADSGVVPNIFTYNILINCLCKAGNVNGAFKLFKELQIKGHSPDTITYATLIDGFQRADRDEDAFTIFEQMTKNGCLPGASVYRSLMTWSCRKKKLSVAFSVWMRYLSCLPGRNNETIKLAGELLEAGDMENAIRNLLDMDFKLRDFDSAPYNIWLIGLCQKCKPLEALKTFSILKEYGVYVSPPSCVMLIHSLCKVGNLDDAINIFLYALERGFIFKQRICIELLKSLVCSQGREKDAFDLLNRMKCAGYILDMHLNESTRFLLSPG